MFERRSFGTIALGLCALLYSLAFHKKIEALEAQNHEEKASDIWLWSGSRLLSKKGTLFSAVNLINICFIIELNQAYLEGNSEVNF